MAEKKELVAKKTGLAGKGHARLNPKVVKDLELAKNDKIEVLKGNKSLKLKIHSSERVDSSEIKLNGKDMKKLDAQAGDKVSVGK